MGGCKLRPCHLTGWSGKLSTRLLHSFTAAAPADSNTTSASMAPEPPAATAAAPAAGAGKGAAMEKAGKGVWSSEQNKLFEKALTQHGEGTPGRWEKVAGMVPGKDAAEVKRHYELLVEDVKLINGGRIAIPSYTTAPAPVVDVKGKAKGKNGAFGSGQPSGSAGIVAGSTAGKPAPSLKSAEQERRKGIPWSEEEHRLFLLGLAKYGKGDWRNISRNFVLSRTPTQVASHAQKYFIRLNSINKERKRTSIHDITSVNNGDVMLQQQGPITGQATVIGQPVVAIGSPMLPSPTVSMAPYPPREGMPVHSSLGPPSPSTKPVMHP